MAVFTQAKLERIPVLLQGDGASATPIHVKELQFNGIRLAAPKFTLESLEGKLEFAPDSSFARAWFFMHGQAKVSARVKEFDISRRMSSSTVHFHQKWCDRQG